MARFPCEPASATLLTTANTVAAATLLSLEHTTTPPVAAFPTPASKFSHKRKSSADVTSVPANPFGLPTPQQGPRLNRLDSDQGQYEQKVRKVLQDIDVPQFETGPQAVSSSVLDDNQGDPFSFVYDKLALQPGRSYEVDLEEIPAYKTPGSKTYRPPAWELQGRQSTDARKFVRLKRDGFTRDEAAAICRKFVDALNRWPDMNAISSPVGRREFGKPRTLVRALFSAAQHSALPNKPLRFYPPAFHSSAADGGSHVTAMIQYIDPQTLQAESHIIPFSHDNVNSEALSADTSVLQSIRFSPLSSLLHPIQEPFADGSDSAMVDLSKVPDNHRQGIRAAERLARLCCAVWLRTKSPFKTLTEVKAFSNDMLRLFVSEKRAVTLDKFYGAGKLWTTRREKVTHRTIVLAKRLQHIVERGVWPSIHLKSSDCAWVKPMSEPAIAEWLRTNDLRSTWIALARAADQVNERILAGETSASLCSRVGDCNSAHPCGLCGITIPCDTLQLHSSAGLRACTSCFRKYPSSVAACEKLSQSRIRQNFHNELQRYGAEISRAILDDNIQAMSTWVTESLQDEKGTSYLCQYTARQLQPPPQATHPETTSIDAVFPIALHHSGQCFIHCAGNLAMTSVALNFLKNLHLPILLVKLSVYYHQYLALDPHTQTGQLKEIRELEQIKRDLVEDCRQLSAIRMKVPRSCKARLGPQLSQEQLAYLKEEWVSGKLRPGSPTAEPPRYASQSHPGHMGMLSEWDDRRPHIIQIIEEIEQWTGIELPRAYDGCPYFAHPDTMPQNWNWPNCFRLMICRTGRMANWCNRKWPTEETPITIFLECIFQVCVGGMIIDANDTDTKRIMRAKYAEFLGLPLDIVFGNPLTFVVAHRVHGQQMRTGWPRHPTRLIDRIDENNNILIETRSSNYFKHSFHEAYYQTLKDHLLNVQVPLEWADESIKPRPFDARLEIGHVEEMDEDGFDEEFISWDLEEDLEDDALGKEGFDDGDMAEEF